MGEIKYNGRTYSGLIQANGCFIDTDNVIVARTQYSSSFTYTATEDCYISLYMVLGASIEIDGEVVFACYSNNSMADGIGLYLRKGQTLSVTGSGNNSSYVVYGLLQGSPITFLSEYASACYDTNEREVGCWIDGKPIYQRTVEISNVSYDGNWHDVAHGISNVESIVQIKGIIKTTSNYYYNCDVARPSTNLGVIIEVTSTNISYLNTYVDNPDKLYVTLLYTKTTDTAGSGKLTPTGFETHHYSTNEQIVGTWIDGKPLYERTWELTIPNSSGTYTYNEVVANLDIVTHTEYSIYGIGERGDVPWYPQATILFSEQSAIGIEFYFASTNYAGRKIYYTSRYTKTTD